MKKLALILVMERLFPFMPMPGANPVLVRKGDLTLYGRRQICL